MAALAEIFLKQLGFFVPLLGGLTILEIFWGRDALSITQRLRGLPFWGVQLSVIVLAGVGAGALTREFGLNGILGGGQLPSPHPAIAAVIVALLIDFIFYWYHRFQHRFLWRWHAPHHAFRNLSAINSHHHWVEPFVFGAMVGFPLSLIGWWPETLPWLALVFTAQRYTIHSDLRFDVGPLRPFLIGPAYHRIHHSIEVEHQDKNFGALTPLWDWLFGTLHWPDCRPAIGVVGFPEPSFRNWIFAPLHYR